MSESLIYSVQNTQQRGGVVVPGVRGLHIGTHVVDKRKQVRLSE